MFNQELASAVQDFTTEMLPLSEKELECDWKWKDHDEEGVRFALFVTLQEMRHLAVILSRHSPQPVSRRIHGVTSRSPGIIQRRRRTRSCRGRMVLKQAYSHILGTDFGFSAVVRYALEGHRSNTWTPDRIPEKEYPRLYGVSDEEYDALMDSPFDHMRSFHRGLHLRILGQFKTISDKELDLPSTFWEETRFPIQHRLHRYEAHFTLHTVQIDKTLVAIGQSPSESKQLLRRIYAAHAEVEGLMIGTEKMDEAAILATASSISERTNEIHELLL